MVSTSPPTGPFLAGLRATVSSGKPAATCLASVSFAVFDDFLPPRQLHRLTQFIAEREKDFRLSGVLHGVSSTPAISAAHRRSRVLFDLGEMRPVFLRHLIAAMPSALATLRIPVFAPSAVDTQATATNDGEFFRPHTDSGAGIVQRRVISYTYFFHTEPARFTGGELCLYSRQGNGDPILRPTATFVPKRNRIVFFPSGVLHEIAPVCCPSGQFGDSRFNVNGWIYR
jgi:SM-20-related protein